MFVFGFLLGDLACGEVYACIGSMSRAFGADILVGVRSVVNVALTLARAAELYALRVARGVWLRL